jgi:cell division protein FtsB
MGNNRYNTEKPGQVRRSHTEQLRALEAENARLKREVAVLTVDKLVLREVIEENGRGGARK